MEVLDGGRGRDRAPHVAADRHAGGQADERTMALAAVSAVAEQRGVEVVVHAVVRAARNEVVHKVADDLRIRREVFLERLGRIDDPGKQIVHQCRM